MRQRILVTDFSKGMVSPRMVPRIDQGKAVEQLTNFVVLPDGGIRRREGSIYAYKDAPLGDLPGFTALDKRITGTETLHLAWIEDSPRQVRVLNMLNRTSTLLTNAQLEYGTGLWDSGKFNNDLESLYAQHVHLWTSGKSHVIDLDNWTIAQKTSQEVSTIFQARMIAVDRTWGTVYMSIPYIYLDFDSPGHLELIPDFYGYENPKWVKAVGGAVYIGTDKSEWMLSSSFPYFSDDLGGLMMQRVSGIGTDMAIIFGPALVIAKDRRIIRIGYSGVEAFQSQSIAELIDNTDILQMDVLEYGSHRYLFFVDSTHKLWCLTECQNTGVAAWSILSENVGWCKAHDQDLYVSVRRNDRWDIEVYPMDNLNFPGGRTETLKDIFFDRKVYADQGGFLSVTSSEVTGDRLPESQTMEVYTYDGTYIGQRNTTAAGVLTGTASDIATFVGYVDEPVIVYCYPTGNEYVSTVKTLPIELGTPLGPGLGSMRKINKVIMRVFETGAFQVRANDGAWESWSSDTLFTGNAEVPIDCGHADIVQLEVRSVGNTPLHIQSMQIDATMGDE